MPPSTLRKPVTDAESGSNRPRRRRLPRIDFVTLMFIVVVLAIVLFLTSELWLTHFYNE